MAPVADSARTRLDRSESRRYPRVIAPLRVRQDRFVVACAVEREWFESTVPRAGIDPPILGYPRLRILHELLASIASDALGRDDLHNQVGPASRCSVSRLRCARATKRRFWFACWGHRGASASRLGTR